MIIANTSTSLFEFCTRNKVRFTSARGDLSVEQLWDVPLLSRDDFNLDAIAKAANRALKAATEESFVQTERTPAHDRLEVMLETVKYIINVKLDEQEKAVRRAANQKERAQLLEILAEKQASKLSSQSEAELKRRIAALSE